METISFPRTIDADDLDLARKEWRLAGLDTDLDETQKEYTVLVVGRKGFAEGKFVYWEWCHSYYNSDFEPKVYVLLHSSLTALEFSKFHDD